MTTATRKQGITILLLSFFIHTNAQDRVQDHNSSRSNKTASKVQDHNSSRSNKTASAQDHNSSRSNKTASKALSDDWTFGVNSGASFAIRSNEGGLFRGNSMATKLFSRYHFGNVGLGFSSGIIPGAINNNSLNSFIIERKFQQSQIIKSNPFNGYLLFGPSFRFGNRVMVNADIQGGMFINNPGAVSIGQAGAVRPLYRFEGAGKNLFPGFSGNISLAYPINSSTRFFINTDYLQSKSSIRLYDPQRGIDVAAEQDRHVKLFTVGVGITKSFGSKRDAASGMASGKKHIGNVKYETLSITEDADIEEKIIVSEQRHAINTKGTGASDGRIIRSAQNHAINTKGPGATNNGRMMNNENCGPVTQTITSPDGTVEELSFACPDDAAMYNNSMDKYLNKEKIVHRDIAARNIISGKLSWASDNNSSGIVTNTTINNTIARQTPKRDFGDRVRIGIREAITGKTKKLKEYGLIFADQGNRTYTSSLGSVKDNPLYSSTAVVNNPLYENGGSSGNNPLFEGKMSSAQGNPLYKGETDDYNCDGIAGIDVSLIDVESGAIVATTTTERCGDFFFANTPDGKYIVKLSGIIALKKGYDLHAESKIDMLGIVQQGDQQVQLLLNTETTNDEMQQRAGISTSRSNIRTKTLTVIEADLDGDGEYESTKILMGFSDGSTRDVTASSKINSTNSIKKVTVRGWDPAKKQARTAGGNLVTEYTINISTTGALLTSQYDNGTKKEAQVMAVVSHHSNVIQFSIPVEDPGADAMTQAVVKTKTKSNQSNDRTASGSAGDEVWSPRSNIKMLKMLKGDVDDDGIPEMLLGGAIPGGAVISAAMRPGDPIPGIDVKLGKNPGGQTLQTTTSNENGEFEFKALEAGDYLFAVEQNIVIDDETIIIVENNAGSDNSPVQENGKGINEAGIKRTDASFVNAAENNMKDLLVSLDELDRLLNTDKKTSTAAINTTKENSRLFRSSLSYQLENGLQKTGTAERTATDTNFAILLGSVNKLGQHYNSISNVLKTKHDVAMNSIRNMK